MFMDNNFTIPLITRVGMITSIKCCTMTSIMREGVRGVCSQCRYQLVQCLQSPAGAYGCSAWRQPDESRWIAVSLFQNDGCGQKCKIGWHRIGCFHHSLLKYLEYWHHLILNNHVECFSKVTVTELMVILTTSCLEKYFQTKSSQHRLIQSWPMTTLTRMDTLTILSSLWLNRRQRSKFLSRENRDSMI